MSHKSSIKEPLIVRCLSCLIIIILTATYLKFHTATHTPEELRSAAEHLLQGQTHWITFQNRLLGPALVEGLRIVTGLSWLKSFQILIAVSLGGGSGFLLWRSWKNTGKSTLGLIETATWFSLAFLFNNTWSYPWDYTGAVLFLLVMAWAKDCFHSLADLKSWRLSVLLVLMALNRESSLIVFSGLILTTLAGGFYENKWSLLFKPLTVLILGSLTNIIGVIYVRHALFTTPTRPFGTEGPETAAGNFNQLVSNLRSINNIDNWDQFWGSVMLVLLFIASSILLIVTLKDVYRSVPIAPGKMLTRSCFCAASAAIVVFAYMSELRVYFELTPIIILLVFESRSAAGKLIRDEEAHIR
jgi:hypothetical protein